jgi:hypothetical protein
MSEQKSYPEMFCSQCNKLTICRSRSIPRHLSCWPECSNRQEVNIWNYKRERECSKCYIRFETFEISATDFVEYCRFKESSPTMEARKREVSEQLDRAYQLIQELSRSIDLLRKAGDRTQS